MKQVLILMVTFLFADAAAQARDVLYGPGREVIPVAFGVETLLRFPMEVKTVTEANRFEVRPANSEEPDYSMLVVKPRFTDGSADLSFILSDGSVIRAQLVVTNKPTARKDSIYDFKPREELPDTNPNTTSQHGPVVISELDLMRAMILGDTVFGFEKIAYSIGIGLGSPDLSAELVTVYRGKEMNGYVYKLRTEQKHKTFEIDLKSLAIGQPNLALVAQIDRGQIGGSQAGDREAFLRIVAKPGASARSVILPVAIQGDSKAGGATQ